MIKKKWLFFIIFMFPQLDLQKLICFPLNQMIGFDSG